MAFLIALDGDLSGQRFSLKSPILVGRGPYNHIVLDDARVSRQHCKIAYESEGYVIVDLNSANGTLVNEIPVRRKTLQPNDVIRFGPFAFRFEGEAPSDADATGQSPRQDAVIEEHTIVGSDPAPKI